MDRLSSMSLFVAIADGEGFSSGARRLGIGRAVASKRIRALEDRLGVRLFNRTTRRISLTEEGEAFLERARRIIAEVEEAEALLTETRGSPSGLLRVSAPLSFGILYLGPALALFCARHPGVHVALSLDDRLTDLVDERADVAIRIGTLGGSANIARRLCGARLVLAAAPDYWARAGRPTRPEDLGQHNCLHYTLQVPAAWRFRDAAQRDHTVAVSGSLNANNGDVLRAAALAGLGVVLLPDFIIGDDLAAGRLEAGLPGYLPPDLGVWAVYPERRHATQRLRAFVDFMTAHLGALEHRPAAPTFQR